MRKELLAVCSMLAWTVSGTVALAQDKPSQDLSSATDAIQTIALGAQVRRGTPL